MMWWDGSNTTWNNGWSWPVAFIMAVGMILCMLMMARMMGHGHRRSASRTGEEERRMADTPERTLANRLATGEIDIEEYKRLQAALHSTGDSART